MQIVIFRIFAFKLKIYLKIRPTAVPISSTVPPLPKIRNFNVFTDFEDNFFLFFPLRWGLWPPHSPSLPPCLNLAIYFWISLFFFWMGIFWGRGLFDFHANRQRLCDSVGGNTGIAPLFDNFGGEGVWRWPIRSQRRRSAS